MIIAVDTFFNMINLAARVGIFIYLVKKYVIKSVTQSMIHEKQDLQYLQQQHAQVQESCKNIESQMKHDQKIFSVLQSKFKSWNQQQDLKKAEEVEKSLKQQKNIEIANLKKIKYLQRQKCIEIEVPDLLDQVEKKLQNHFYGDINLSKKYQTKVLDALEKLQ